MSCLDGLATRSRRSFQNFERGAPRDSQSRAHSNRQRDVFRGNVTGAQTECNRYLQIAENASHDLLKRVARACRRGTLEHLTENNSPHLLQLARVLQVHQHSIDAIGPLTQIFEKQDCVFRSNLVRRPERRHKQRETSSIEFPFSFPCAD